MAEESEKRIQAIMDKLFYSPRKSSISQSTPPPLSNSTSYSGTQSSRGVKRSNPTNDLSVPNKKSIFKASTEEAPRCRPWDRGDLMKRLATFKSMTWFGKPQVVNPVNCARRGWVNVDADTIACESCGARLFFTTPSAWMQHQVEKAALVFSLKLDSGHKLLCPWIDNACDETLAQFPPATAEVLVDEYKKRVSAFLHLSALPTISASAVNRMRSPLLEHFLKGSSDESSNESAYAPCTEDLGNENMPTSVTYYQAKKLLSLCGWEPRLLPYIVDCKNQKNESRRDANSLDLSRGASNAHTSKLVVYSSGKGVTMGANNDLMASEQCDPSSVVLDCRLCGASVGLWFFSTVPRPLEFLRVVGYTKIDGGNGSNPEESAIGSEKVNSGPHDLETRQSTTSTSACATFSTERKSNLNLTIAGGPTPTVQNYRATISMPVIGRNLRARFSSDPEFRDRSGIKNPAVEGNNHGEIARTGTGFQPEQNSFLRGKQVNDISELLETSGPASITEDPVPDAPSVVDGSSEGGELLAESIATTDPDQAGEHSMASTCDDVTIANGKVIEADVSMTVETNSSDLPQIASTAIVCSEHANNQDGNGTKDRAQSLNNDVQPSRRGENIGELPLKDVMEFDPINQHRPFCPWISSFSNSPTGWQQTLTALHRQKEFSCPSATDTPSSSLIEVDDPITSIRKLFTPPSTKRMKLVHDSS